MGRRAKLTLAETALFGILGAVTFAAQVVMGPLPNIEPVSLFCMVFAVVFGAKCLYPIYVFVVLEVLFYGLQLWVVNYLYIWALLAGAAWLMRRAEAPLSWAILSGSFGLLFGALCAPVYLFTGGPGFALSWWASGLLFDIYHCVGNFVLALLLFNPLRRLLTGLYARLRR